MADRISLANRALTLCGAARIMDLADAQKPAKAIAAVYEGVRDQCLAVANWRFAMKKFNPQVTTAPLFHWAYAYIIPAEILRLVEIRDIFVGYGSLGPAISDGTPQMFEVEQGVIQTNFEPPLNCRGVQKLESEALFDPLFCNYFVHCLAYEIWEDVSRKGATKKDVLIRERDRALRIARNKDATIEPPEELPDDNWLLARSGP